MTIWIVKKHRWSRIAGGYLEGFTIEKAFATRKEAAAFAKIKASRAICNLYRVGKVQVKETP